jgi:branched-chain amino acid transport system permease protein
MIMQLLIKGLSLGAIYGMISIGFSLLWQTSRTINFAQGEFVTVPAFLMVLFYVVFHIPFVPALICTILISAFLLGVLMKKTLVEALIERGVLPLVVATIAVGFAFPKHDFSKTLSFRWGYIFICRSLEYSDGHCHDLCLAPIH